MDQYLIDKKYPTVENQFHSLNNRIFICSEKINTPTSWRMNKSTSISTPFNCRSFEWERILVQSNYSEYKTTLDGHSMCQIGEYIYIFGGRIHNDFTNRLTRVNIHKLSVMHIEDFMPDERAFHCAAAYGNKMIIFGGHNKAILQDYHAFNTTERTWLPSPMLKGKSPSKREKQTCVLYQTLLVLFGGYYCSPDFQFEHTYNDIQVLDIEEMKWIDEDSIKVNEKLPNPRFSHVSQLVHSNMYIFGGKNIYNQKGISCHINYNDLWVINLENVSNLHWEQIKPKGTPPLARHGHTMNALNNYLVIFGGQGDKKQKFNDVIVFDTEKLEWIYPIIKCKSGNCKPLPRVYHGATSVNNEYIVIFGGQNINQKSTSFSVLRPINIKLDLNIEQEDQPSDTQNQQLDKFSKEKRMLLESLSQNKRNIMKQQQ